MIVAMNLTMRAAEVGDLPGVLALWRDAGAEPSHTDDLASLTRLVTHDAHALTVAEDDDRIIGSVVAGWDGWRGSIYRLAVAPEHRRRGVGTTLLRHAEQRLADAGAVRNQAIVVGSDSQATSFWRASGWEQQSDRTRFVTG
jgi:ribosomal protein S18 acetylase RimI-like enzyme